VDKIAEYLTHRRKREADVLRVLYAGACGMTSLQVWQTGGTQTLLFPLLISRCLREPSCSECVMWARSLRSVFF
jgi:hypothetical protein